MSDAYGLLVVSQKDYSAGTGVVDVLVILCKVSGTTKADI